MWGVEGKEEKREGARRAALYMLLGHQPDGAKPARLAEFQQANALTAHAAPKIPQKGKMSTYRRGSGKMLVLRKETPSRSAAHDCAQPKGAGIPKPGTRRMLLQSSTTSVTQITVTTVVLSVQTCCRMALESGVLPNIG